MWGWRQDIWAKKPLRKSIPFLEVPFPLLTPSFTYIDILRKLPAPFSGHSLNLAIFSDYLLPSDTRSLFWTEHPYLRYSYSSYHTPAYLFFISPNSKLPIPLPLLFLGFFFFHCASFTYHRKCPQFNLGYFVLLLFFFFCSSLLFRYHFSVFSPLRNLNVHDMALHLLLHHI